MLAKTISRKIRRQFFYSVPGAGKLVGLGRTQSYRAAELGQIPTEKAGKLLLVPRDRWDREVKNLLRPKTRSRAGRGTSAIEAIAE